MIAIVLAMFAETAGLHALSLGLIQQDFSDMLSQFFKELVIIQRGGAVGGLCIAHFPCISAI